ncbi:hypothetical protein SEPCBS119000_003672 [Sporothrix epigloea]|uniref:Btz domain-containing protein n=1 Tax=Sporothrix epigloea TaxID=1892477 RepID=A0ABP0DRM7_9PEZI
MATATTAPTLHSQKRHGHRQRQVVSRRRRIGEEDSSGEGVQGANDPVNDDSLSGESTASDEGGPSNESDMKGIDETPQTLPMSNSLRKSPEPKVNSSSKSIAAPLPGAPTGEANGLSSTVSEPQSTTPTPGDARTTTSAPRAAQPAIVSSSAAPTPRRETAYDRQRREHDLYKQRRDEDPSFVPNRGAFFMHDHRGAGPAANGFRPFSSRSARSSRGRGGFGGSYLPMQPDSKSALGP